MPARSRVIGAAILLAAITFFCFWGVFHNGFITVDDTIYVTENGAVRNGLTWDGVVKVFTTVSFSYWQPLAYVSHMVDVELFGLVPGPHHLVSVALHCLSSALLFFALFRLTGAMYRSLFVAALFALHPMHVEPVAWIASRKDVLSGLFFVIGLLTYSWYNQDRTTRRLVYVSLAFALGLMAKPQILAFPLILMLLDFWPLRRSGKGSLQEKAPLFVLAISSALITLSSIAFTGKLETDLQSRATTSSRLSTVATMVAGYLPKFFWPDHLSIFYLPTHLAAGPILAFGCAALVLGICVAAFRFRSHLPFVFVGWFWFLLMLLPTTGLLMADRFSYTPFIGLSIAAVWSVAALVEGRPVLQWCAAAAGTAVIAIFCVLVTQRVEAWRSTDSIFDAAFAEDPGNFQVHYWRGTAYGRASRYQEAIKEFETSLRSRPNFSLAELGLARTCRRAGMADEALRHFINAAKLRPGDPSLCKETGDLLMGEGRLAESLVYYKKARDLNYPDMQGLAMVIRSVELSVTR